MKKEIIAPEYYTLEQIQQEFSKKKDKVSLLWEALDYMSQYNGRSRWDCVALAMGYSNYEGRNNTYEKTNQ